MNGQKGVTLNDRKWLGILGNNNVIKKQRLKNWLQSPKVTPQQKYPFLPINFVLGPYLLCSPCFGLVHC